MPPVIALGIGNLSAALFHRRQKAALPVYFAVASSALSISAAQINLAGCPVFYTLVIL